MKKKILKITILFAILFANLYLPKETSANILEVSVDDIYVTAGEINRIEISLKNVGELDVYTVEALLSSQSPGIQILEESHKVYDEILKGKVRRYYPKIYVNQNTPLGGYKLSLNVQYIRYGSLFDSTITVPIGIVVSKGFTPRLSLSSGTDTVNVKSGTSSTLQYAFKNNGEENLTNIEFTLKSTVNHISIVNGISQSFENLAPGETVNVAFTVSILEGTPLGVYVISATVTYGDESERQYFQEFVLLVNIDQAAVSKNTVITIKEMNIFKEKISPGEDFELQIDVECSGANAYEVLSTLSFPSILALSPLNPTRVNIGDLDDGESVTVSYRILVSGDIPAGQYPVTATIDYTNSRGIPSRITETLTVLVEGLIDFEILDAPSLTTKKGEVTELEADLLLIGTESVQFVSIELVEDDVFEKVTGSTEYIGAVDPDSPIPFDLNYKVRKDAADGNYDMELNVHYRDHLNREHEEGLALDVEVSEQSVQEPQGPVKPGFWVWIRRLFGLGP